MQTDQKNPLFPIDVDDYPKLFDYVLTATSLRSKCINQKKI